MVRRSKKIQEIKGIDRISDLPNSILYHILSFVDTKSSVKTCILSRRWRCVWKHVDVLSFSQISFRSIRDLEQSVDRVLSLRCDGSRVRKVRAEFVGERSIHPWDRLMKYAASHGVEELFICDHNAESLDVIASVCSCYQSLKVLELKQMTVDQNVVRFWSRLELLESLTLTTCRLNFDHEAFAANFPRLETLKLDHCYYHQDYDFRNSVLKVTGSKLLSLEIVFPGFSGLEISCPKLQSLSLELNPNHTITPDVSSKSNLPSLNRANIKFFGNWHAWFDSTDPKQMQLERCANLFKILHNVQALDLQVETFELLLEICNLLEHQASPFTRMKFFNLKCCGRSHDVPDQAVHYFRGGSPNEEAAGQTKPPISPRIRTLKEEAFDSTGRSKRIQNRIDRLSDLPDSILHHILSFLDTKSSVQTCILSKRWRCVWKYVEVLTFSQSSSRSNRDFERYVDKVLSLRCDGSRVRKVRIDFEGEQSMHLWDRIMKYAASHGIQELFICDHYARSLNVVASVCSCYQSLKVLELNRISFGQNVFGLWSRLELIESLTLTRCAFNNDDVFAYFPRLETLKLDRCFKTVIGYKLLNSEIDVLRFNSIGIVAPKLQSLSLEIDPFYRTRIPDLSKSNLPSLNRANIKLLGNWHVWFDSSDYDARKQMLIEWCAKLFKILHNVQALDLQVETFELLIQTCSFVEHQASPFKRMKLLNLKCCRGSPEVPDQVIRYFLGGSPNEEGKRFTVEKLR
ncbi:Putative F-box/LRR-repeat protein At5g02930 [Linum perenne]